MSFIFDDKKLLVKLISEGQKAVPKKLDIDTTNPYTITPEMISVSEAAKRLLFGLQKDLGDPAAPVAAAPIGVEGGAPVDPKELTAFPKDLRTLGDFLQWASQKKLTWDNKRIAWAPGETSIPDSAWEFTSMRTNRDDRQIDRKPEEVKAYADKDALISYLTYLRDSDDAKSNQVLQFMLSTLIGEANGYLRIAKEKPIDLKTPTTPKDAIDPRTIVDVVPAVLDPNNPTDGLDNHPFKGNKDELNWLQVSDLKDQNSFMAWLRNRKIKIPAKDKNPAKEVGALQIDGGDPCLAVHIIYKRALALKNVAAADDGVVPNYSKAVALYMQQVVAFGRMLTSADGKNCDVITPGTQTPGASGDKPGTGGPAKKVSPETIGQIINSMPLNPDNINFNEIESFFRLYEGVVSESGTALAAGAIKSINDARAAMNNAKNKTIRGNTVYDMTADVTLYANMLQPPAYQRYLQLMYDLDIVVTATKEVVEYFYTQYGKQMNPDDQSLVQAQFQGNYSYAVRNRDIINRLKSRVNEVLKFQ